MDTSKKKKASSSAEEEKFPLPVYKDEDDIYSKGEELSLEEIENPDKITVGSEDEVFGSELDIPGTELDDANEAIGEEDEENNYYSLGGEDHEDLKEGNSDML